ncbi:MAG: hypothetical protein IPN90_05215 [Elusimicrobia bacterium]|nr:hypothetical protein [Elusimicrobiota bacterium]
MAMAILGIVLVMFGDGFFKGLRSVVRVNSQTDAVMDIQNAMILMEKDFEEMTRVESCGPQTIVFQLDSNRLPNYDPNADSELFPAALDGVPNDLDIDDDGDMTGFNGVPVPGTDFNGNDLWDQDDDNNGQIDVLCRYFVANGDLVRDFNINGAGWGQFGLRQTVLRGVMGDVFDFVGSLNHIPGPIADIDGDGIVKRAEIDSPPIGNGNGILDTPAELVFVDSIALTLSQDRNGDGNPEFRLNTRVRPPLLSTNRRVL